MSEAMKDFVPHIDEFAGDGGDDKRHEEEQEERAKTKLFEIMDVLDGKDGFWVKQGGKLQKGLEWNVLPHDGGERTYYTWVDEKGVERNGRVKTGEFIQWQKEYGEMVQQEAAQKSREQTQRMDYSVKVHNKGTYEDNRTPKRIVEPDLPSVIVDPLLEVQDELRKEIAAVDEELKKQAEEQKENALSEEEARDIITTISDALEVLTKDGRLATTDKQRERTLRKISQWKEKVQQAFGVIDKKKDPKNSKTIGPIWYRAKVLMQDLEIHAMNLEQKDTQKNETLEQALEQLRTQAQTEREEIVIQSEPKSSRVKTWIAKWATRLTLASLGALAVDSSVSTHKSHETTTHTSRTYVEGQGISSLEIERSKPEITVQEFIENYDKISDPQSTETPEIKIDTGLSRIIKEKHEGQIPEKFSVSKTNDNKAVKLVFDGGSTIVANPAHVQKGNREYWRLNIETPADAVGRLRATLTEMSKKYPEIFGNRKADVADGKKENSIFDLKSGSGEVNKVVAQTVKLVEQKLAEAEKKPGPKETQKLLEDSLNVFKDVQKKYFKKPGVKRTRAERQADSALEMYKKTIDDILKDYPSIEEGDLGNSL